MIITLDVALIILIVFITLATCIYFIGYNSAIADIEQQDLVIGRWRFELLQDILTRFNSSL